MFWYWNHRYEVGLTLTALLVAFMLLCYLYALVMRVYDYLVCLKFRIVRRWRKWRDGEGK